MKCHQCDRPAFFCQGPDGNIPLCLSCSSKLQDILNAQFIQNAAMMNQALDDMDMVIGVNSGGPRIPIGQLARAMQKAPTYTNISVNNSQVGVLNNGEIARIDAAITLTKDSDVEAMTATSIINPGGRKC